jgi:hypothetical protein
MCKIKTHAWINKVRIKFGQQAVLEEFNGKLELTEDVV